MTNKIILIHDLMFYFLYQKNLIIRFCSSNKFQTNTFTILFLQIRQILKKQIFSTIQTLNTICREITNAIVFFSNNSEKLLWQTLLFDIFVCKKLNYFCLHKKYNILFTKKFNKKITQQFVKLFKIIQKIKNLA